MQHGANRKSRSLTPVSLRTQALRLLSRRDYSRQELTRRLAEQAETPEALASLLDSLESSGLLSDERYAGGRARSRGPRLGDARLRNELHQRGVADELITEALSQLPGETARARAVWQRKFGTAPTDRAAWAKQARFLLSRGFSMGTIRSVLGHTEEPDCTND